MPSLILALAREWLSADIDDRSAEGTMASSRISRGFHRLGLFLAAIPLLAGVAISYFVANDFADGAWQTHQKAACAHQYIARKVADTTASKRTDGRSITGDNPVGGTSIVTDNPDTWLAGKKQETVDEILARIDKYQADPSWLMSAPDDARLDLKHIGCSDAEYDTISLGEARANPAYFSWADQLAAKLGISLAITLAVSLCLYGLVRAIGWVIGGFASS
jgi:hypothetical protein